MIVVGALLYALVNKSGLSIKLFDNRTINMEEQKQEAMDVDQKGGEKEEKGQGIMEEAEPISLVLEAGVSAIQGRRPYMEDRHTVILDMIKEALNLNTREEDNDGMESIFINLTRLRQISSRHSLFAVFDGHGGQLASSFASTYFYQHLLNSEHLPESPVKALEEACDITDRLYADKHKIASSQDGTTACMVLLVGRRIYAANIGDSRAVLSRKGTFERGEKKILFRFLVFRCAQNPPLLDYSNYD